MSQANLYGSIVKRGFESALMRLLQEEYRFLGGPRIQWLLVEDVQKLLEEHFPTLEHTASGTLVWTCTADEGKKAEAGKPTEEYKTVTVHLPLVTKEDLQERTERHHGAQEREKRQVARLIQSAAQQGGLLTQAELSVIMNRSCPQIARYVQEWQAENGKLLPMKGYKMDQGSSPTHKAEIIRLFEQGKEPPDIARESNHSLQSVERYLKDYERVRMLLKSGNDINAISLMINRGRKVVVEYVKIAQEFHPDLFPTSKC